MFQHKHNNSKGVFFVSEEEEIVAELTYSMQQEHQMMIDHTEVNEELRGGNIGYELVLKAVDYARTHHYTIIPACEFASAVLEKKPKFKDVLA